jgi:TRAP-type C4-dicarboxylate transport system substrate-binding protein
MCPCQAEREAQAAVITLSKPITDPEDGSGFRIRTSNFSIAQSRGTIIAQTGSSARTALR